MNSDDLRLLRSSGKSLWPVWFAVANLPPKLRSTFKKIVLASLWFRLKKTSWNHVFEVIYSVILLKSNFFGLLKVQFFLVYWEGTWKETEYWFSKDNGQFELPRCPFCLQLACNCLDVEYASPSCYLRLHIVSYWDKITREDELLSIETNFNENTWRASKLYWDSGTSKFTAFKGVKSRGKLFDIIPNLPLAAPIDVVLQVYLGVVKVLLHVIVSKAVKSDIEYINNIVRSLKVSCISI